MSVICIVLSFFCGWYLVHVSSCGGVVDTNQEERSHERYVVFHSVQYTAILSQRRRFFNTLQVIANRFSKSDS